MKIPDSAIHPLGMLAASSLNFFGAISAMIAVPSSRSNPFFYTAMATSLIYMLSNGIKVAQEFRQNRNATKAELEEILSSGMIEKEMARREQQAREALNKFYHR